ncbi:MAG: pyridoxal phosphate-dependent aminotransferase [Candidatus Omnitrophica bacterium]|nr:pyridoxal phosphate-dependent aminotransferase [Candidatus Omnitrophota bacterium]MBU4487558.1 pyridoxal phosphate-dependent aminotransferase [Candidatus Omnitrophota bacterium]MCG2705798.1 pyridoxal phosphate-dependent aminotransferase [Candidatus Omnitrophota bacterium]
MMITERLKYIASSATLDITTKAKALKKGGFDVINFAGGEPDFDTPQYIKKSAIDAINKGFTKYTPATGTAELKEAVSKKFKNDNGLDYKPGQVIISCGAKHALYNIFQAICEKGDEVLIPMPYWLSYPEMIKMSEARPVIVESDENTSKVTPERLEKCVTKRTKALIINSPSNPTGIVYSKDELKALADFAVGHNVFVISDEIYEKLIYDGLKHVSIASFNKKIYDLTFVVNGVSKSYSMTGWRIGYLAGREDIVKSIAAFQSHSTSNPTSISQAAALAALTIDDPSTSSMVREFEKRRNILIKGLGEIRELKCNKPEGAFYCFVDISKTGMSPAVFSKRLLDEEYIATIPGEPFGSNKHVRFSFATSTADIEKGLERLKKWVKR